MWIPHVAFAHGARRRDEYFIDHLQKHCHIHILTWTVYRGRIKLIIDFTHHFLRDITFGCQREEGYWVHFMPRLPSPLAPYYPKGLILINQCFLHIAFRRIKKRTHINTTICAPNYWLIGYPPFGGDVPIIFDYLDCLDWECNPFFRQAEQGYLKNADAVLCVSHIGLKRAQRFNSRCYYLPNGVDLQAVQAAHGDSVRHQLGIENCIVVSLIGLGGTSERLYFIDAVLKARKRIQNLKCMLVGSNPIVKKRIQEVDPYGQTFILVGPVSYPEVLNYFCASDIGLYPVDETLYYHAASPIKIFEYAAAGKPVIAPRLHELIQLGLPNVVFCPPDADSFADAIIAAVREPPPPCPIERLSDFDWAHLSRRLMRILEEVSVK